MAERQSAAQAFTGFLAPETVHAPPAPKARSTPRARVSTEGRQVLDAIADGKVHYVEAVRKRTGLPLMRFVDVVRDLAGAGLVEMTERAGKDAVVLTEAGAGLIGA